MKTLLCSVVAIVAICLSTNLSFAQGTIVSGSVSESIDSSRLSSVVEVIEIDSGAVAVLALPVERFSMPSETGNVSIIARDDDVQVGTIPVLWQGWREESSSLRRDLTFSIQPNDIIFTDEVVQPVPEPKTTTPALVTIAVASGVILFLRRFLGGGQTKTKKIF